MEYIKTTTPMSHTEADKCLRGMRTSGYNMRTFGAPAIPGDMVIKESKEQYTITYIPLCISKPKQTHLHGID